MTISQDEAFARIRLLRSPNIGPISYRQLIARFGDAARALEALPDLASRKGGSYKLAPADRVSREIDAVRKLGARYLFIGSPDFPPLLAELETAPPILTFRGDLALLALPAIAVVGARNASAGAIKLARDFSLALAEAGHVVVSGLARGIDGAAHHGALAGGARTIGVIASGIDIAYPPEHAKLQERIAEEALLLAEQPPGVEPLARHFPSRNRIIAGLAAGTLVVEAAPKSGSLITARLAGEAGREVMAIPGSPLDSRSAGCNQLIRDGAMLVQSPDEVLELVTGFAGAPRSRFRDTTAAAFEPDAELESADESADLGHMLGVAPIGIDELIRQSGQSTAAVQLELELAGRLVRHAAGRVSLAPAREGS